VETVELPQIVSIDSKIYLLKQVSEMINCISNKERKMIGKGMRDKDWLLGRVPKIQKDLFSRLNFSHFIHQPNLKSYVILLDRMIEQSNQVLDLTHNYSVTPTILDQIKDNQQIRQIIINQNFRLSDFHWLRHFPNLVVINLSSCHQIEYNQIEQILQMVPHLHVFNLHCCTRINIRIMIPLLKLRELECITINDPEFWCQKGRYELFILPEEWKGLDCPSLQQISINSTNLTLDIIDYLINACSDLHQITVDDEILKQVSENIVEGHQTDNQLIFNSWKTPNKGISVPQRVSFTHLIKDTYDSQMFSDSMLKKIEEIRQMKGEKEQTPIV
jgi:hypothetical protein